MTVDSLFEPFAVRNLELASRFVMSPMTYYRNDGGRPTDEFAAYHAERAAHDLGLSITGATSIDRPAASNHPKIATIDADTVDDWRRVVDRVHAAGGPIALQIWHAGALFRTAPDHRPAPLESPSGLVDQSEVIGEPMSDEQVLSCIDEFGKAAARGRDAGFDAVEIHGAHGFLIDQFFWDATNRRGDRWGGATLVERSRMAVEVVKAVRAAVGDDYPVFLRISQWKEQDYGVKLAPTPADLVAWLGPLADAGVDVFHCSQRRFWEPEFDGSDLNLAGWVKKELARPTITVGSVGLSNDVMSFFDGQPAAREPLDELVRRFDRGDFDLVAVGRAVLADPAWVSRVRSGDDVGMEPIDSRDLDLGIH